MSTLATEVLECTVGIFEEIECKPLFEDEWLTKTKQILIIDKCII